MDHERLQPQLSLLVTSPRVAPGLLSADAWGTLRSARHVVALDAGAPQPAAVAAAGVAVTPLTELLGETAVTPSSTARALLRLVGEGPVVWIGSGDGDPGLSEALAVELPDEAPALELLVGSWDTPGSRLLDAVTVMDRLRSPGGCPWDAEQTHASLAPYLIEEAHEAVEVLERLDEEGLPEDERERLRSDAAEELGDVLLQVLFHARVAADDQEDPFDVDDVAAGLVAKLVRRHPHVFGSASADDAAAVEARWEEIKRAEKPGREHPLDGIPTGMPPLARAAKVASRLDRAGRGEWLGAWVRARAAEGDPGARLLAEVLAQRSAGTDPDAALRATLREVHQATAAAPPDQAHG